MTTVELGVSAPAVSPVRRLWPWVATERTRLALAVLLGSLAIGCGVALMYHNIPLGWVMGAALLINNLNAGLSGILIPLVLERFRIDPAVSSAVFVTMMTDVLGFFSFLGLASIAGLAG